MKTQNQDAFKAIQQIFEFGEVQRITFLKKGKVSVKYRTEPNVVYYNEKDLTLDIISGELEIRKSLARVSNKPKLVVTKQELNVLNKMNNEAFFEVKPSLFERFYDYVGNFINGGKSIAPAELKTFA